MTQVDFYILGSKSGRTLELLVCQLCNKALENNMHVYINVRSEQQAAELDDLLWSFKPESFLPHQNLLSNQILTETSIIPIIINKGEQIPDGYDQLLINLNSDIPQFFSRFDRVAEIVAKDENEKQLGRDRYRFYRERGYLLNKYDL
jgi:DNA polymerase-3 subunit chi